VASQRAAANAAPTVPAAPVAERRPLRRVVESAIGDAVERARDGTLDIPDRAEIDEMLGEIGLAATIEQLRRRTGWDFKDVVAYLQKHRRGR
jgi:hypothetical protein